MGSTSDTEPIAESITKQGENLNEMPVEQCKLALELLAAKRDGKAMVAFLAGEGNPNFFGGELFSKKYALNLCVAEMWDEPAREALELLKKMPPSIERRDLISMAERRLQSIESEKLSLELIGRRSRSEEEMVQFFVDGKNSVSSQKFALLALEKARWLKIVETLLERYGGSPCSEYASDKKGRISFSVKNIAAEIISRNRTKSAAAPQNKKLIA